MHWNRAMGEEGRRTDQVDHGADELPEDLPKYVAGWVAARDPLDVVQEVVDSINLKEGRMADGRRRLTQLMAMHSRKAITTRGQVMVNLDNRSSQ